MDKQVLGNSFEVDDSNQGGYPSLDEPAKIEYPSLSLGDKEVSNNEPEVKKLDVSQVLPKTPKQLYFEQVKTLWSIGTISGPQTRALISGLETLYEFGFVDFDKNKMLLETNENNIEVVVQILVEQQAQQ